MHPKPLLVVAGIIHKVIEQKHHLLLAERPTGKMFAGKMEFPGGKVELGEQPLLALKRELFEELDIEIDLNYCTKLMNIPWQYPQLNVNVLFFQVYKYSGEVCAKEGQTLHWLPADEVQVENLLEANKGVLNALKLPNQMAITGDYQHFQDFYNRLAAIIRTQNKLIQIRMDATDWSQWGKELLHHLSSVIKKNHCSLLLNWRTSSDKILPPEFLGWHFGSQDLTHLSSIQADLNNRLKPPLISSAVHNLAELQQAIEQKVDMVCCSPVQPTTSHPERKALGWQQFSKLCDLAPMPVFALGGMTQKHLPKAKLLNAHGIAGISEYWEIS